MFLVCGEALFDFILEDEEGPGAATYAARAGGAPFNVAVGLARLGQAVGLLAGVSTDLLGQRLRRVLEAEGVATGHLIATDRPTTISLVGVDAAGVPAYRFYDAGSAATGVTAADLAPVGDGVSGLHFGSCSIAAAPVADALHALARAERGRFIALDPNVRPTALPDMAVWRRRVDALAAFADLVKLSAEDLALLRPGMAADGFADELIGRGVRLVVLTDGGGPVRGWTAAGVQASVEPPRVEVVDTVGGGDTFQAALLARLLAHPAGPVAALDGLDPAGLAALLGHAARAASLACTRRGAAMPRADEIA